MPIRIASRFSWVSKDSRATRSYVRSRYPIDGPVQGGQAYYLVDDFVGQGGTLANLAGFIRGQGGVILGATVLTGKPYSAKLAPDEAQIRALRAKHGAQLEEWWRQSFGFGFDCLTRSEARYLEKTADADTIRSRIAAAGSAGGT